MSIIAKNLYVSVALLVATAVLVAFEVRVLSAPPSGAWFAGMLTVALFGFGWANAGAFVTLNRPSLRRTAAAALVLAIWAVVSVAAIVLGVNLKMALGGQL